MPDPEKVQPRVLIIEDTSEFAFCLEHFFSKRWGWRAAVSPDGEDAIVRLDEVWDLIVLDLMLPCLSGVEVLAEVRRRKLATPVAVCTNKTLWDAEEVTADLHPERLFMKDQLTQLGDYAAAIKARFDTLTGA